MLQSEYERDTKDGEVFETSDLADDVKGELVALAGEGAIVGPQGRLAKNSRGQRGRERDCIVSPPQSSGAASTSVCVRIHWWPNGSSRPACRSP
jgi:hypothetical protein